MRSLLTRLAAFVFLATPSWAWASPLGNADEIQVGGGGGAVDLKQLIINITRNILTFISLIAVVVIIIAGIWMIVGFGSETSKERAKKIVIYTIVGLVLILIARAIVTFIIRIF